MKVLAILCLCVGAAVGFREPKEQSCEGKAESGMCLAYMPMYYYDAETDTCKRFIYGGCQGNGNRYATEEKCLGNCKGYNQQKAVDICSLKPEKGPCRGFFPKYYFDKDEGICKEMVYGGCRGNANRFETLEECNDNCAPEETPVLRSESSNCSDEPETGLCRGYFPMYYYDKNSGDCKRFIYGGCGGNGNRYITKIECLKACQ